MSGLPRMDQVRPSAGTGVGRPHSPPHTRRTTSRLAAEISMDGPCSKI